MKNLKFYAYNIIVVFIVLVVLELLAGHLLDNPAQIPDSFIKGFRSYYRQFDRVSIQVMPECAQFDSELFYTLKPGEFNFNNREFRTRYSVNSLGLRDNDGSLRAPSIITLGDSFTMGWGVNQDSTFSDLIEQKLGEKVLNAGISSYGTARELRLLRRLQPDSSTTLLIQYHPNDIAENKSFVENGFQLNISPKATYDSLVETVSDRIGYYPGKQIALSAKEILKSKLSRYAPEERNTENEVKLFLEVLNHYMDDLPFSRIIIFEINSHNDNSDTFVTLLQREIDKSSTHEYLKRVRTIDISSIIDASDYYILDDHLRFSGHEKIANTLIKELK